MVKSNYKIIIISILNNFRKKNQPILILETKLSIFGTKKTVITIIDTNTYQTTYKLNEAQVFAISIRDLEYQVEKET